MKILIVGGGGREHALVWSLARAGHSLLAAPGNPGIARHAECLDIGVANLQALDAAARYHKVDLAVIGPEAPLVAGLADRLRDRGIAVFGPSQSAARLEGSKIFAKEFFARHGIPTPDFRACGSVEQADAALDEFGDRVVVKADGLAAGKGVIVCSSRREAERAAIDILEKGRFGDAGKRVLVERRLLGRELSVMAITDGRRYELLAQAEDYKQVGDGDRGPNSGGMGSVSPAPLGSDELIARIKREIFTPTLRGLSRDGIDFRGVLYAGLMIDDAGSPWILEYNCRFGDPESQAVLLRARGDLGRWLAGAAAGRLPEEAMPWDERAAVCVVAAAAGYPGEPELGRRIEGLDALDEADDLVVFHAGTAWRDGALVTAGGRVLGVTALASDSGAARRRAYEALAAIHFSGMHYRRDIGARGASS